MSKDIHENNNEENKGYYDEPTDQKVGESPISKSAPSNSWMEDNIGQQSRHKRGLSQTEIKNVSTNIDSMIRQFQKAPEGRKNSIGHRQEERPPQQYSQRNKQSPRRQEQQPYDPRNNNSFFQESPNRSHVRMDQLTMSDVHAIIDENQSLLAELEAMSHQFQMEKMDLQRRLRHITARVQYLEDFKCNHSSPDLNNDGIKPYQMRRPYHRQPSNRSRKQTGEMNDNVKNNHNGFGQEKDGVTDNYASSESPDAIIHSENINNNNNKARRRPPFSDYYSPMRNRDDNRYMPVYPNMFPPPPNGRFEDDVMASNYYNMRRFYQDSPRSDEEDDMDDEFYSPHPGKYGPHPPQPPAPSMMGGPPPPPPPFMGPPMMQAPPPPPPPPPMGYGPRQPWMMEPYPDRSMYRHKQRYTSSQPQSEDDEEQDMIFRQFAQEEEQDMQRMMHQMSMGPMMYGELHAPFNNKFNGPLRRISSRRSAPGSGRSSFINGSR